MDFEKYERLLKRVCSRFPILDWNDAYSEAQLAYLRALDSYKPDKGAFSTHLWTVVRRALISQARAETKRRKAEGLTHVSNSVPGPDRMLAIRDLMDALDDDARHVVGLIYEPENVLHCKRHGANVSRHLLAKYLRGHGWSGTRIREAFRNIQTAMEATL